MRQARLKAPADWGISHYHVVSRVVDRAFVLGPEEREQFIGFMRMYERLCGVQVLTYCILSNHFHLLIAVPRPPESPPTEQDVLSIVRQAHGSKRADALAAELHQVRAMAGDATARELLDRWTGRMWDISQFMKTLKQRFTQWFNKRHKRKGTLWEERFRSSLVEGSGQALHMVSAYIDLNPVRAGICDDPKDYRWSGYGEAVGGGKVAQAAFASLMRDGVARPVGQVRQRVRNSKGDLDPAPRRPLTTAGKEAVLAAYRALLFGIGGEEGVREDGSPIRLGFDAERVRAELVRGGRLGSADFLRCRVRYFTDGAVLGSRRFVDGVFEALRDRFGEKRRDGARRVRELGEVLYSLRALRLDPVSIPATPPALPIPGG